MTERSKQAEKPVRARVIVSGRVQGVCFRFYTRETAESLGLSGWVRNCPDGTVEAVFEGPDSSVREMTEWCRRGPVGARVVSAKVSWEPYSGEYTDFRIVH